MTGDRRPRPRSRPVRVVFLDLPTDCDRCGGVIEPGAVVVAYRDRDPVWFEHDGGCPARWTPEVIDGGRKVASRRLSGGGNSRMSASPVQLALPLLTAVADIRDGEGPS